ncbi:MAG TPA: DUF5666 domain-containing protein, partial [Gemmatimonadales bacterium]|nr:DUF5666 domain-containing protein [Gemmatimonadales bacterium]
MKAQDWLTPLVLAGSVALTACADGTGPTSSPQFSREISLPQFEQTLTQGPARVEIELTATGLVAREIEIKEPAEMADEEEIESRITAIAVNGSEGVLTLALGGLQVRFTAATEFEAEDADLSFGDFVARVEAALAAGREPAVEAERPPAAVPQAPDDPGFLAAELDLDDEADEPEIELNVDGDNLASCAALAQPPAGCVGAVRVLGLAIAIVQGVTELQAEVDDAEGEAEFEGLVRSVDVAGGSVTLENGTVIRIVPGTDFETEGGDDDQLRSLAEVAEALAAGRFVEADGKGVVEATAPLPIVAIEIEFELEDEPGDVPGGVEFEG